MYARTEGVVLCRAAAILGDEDAGSSTKVTMGDLATLVRYVADMIEE